MTLTAVLEIAVAVALVALIAYFAFVLTGFRRAVAAVEQLAVHADEQLLPVALKAGKTLDELNTELARIEGIVHSVEDVTHKVAVTADVARHALSSPLVKIAGWSAGMRKAAATLRHREDEGEEP